MIKAIIFDFDDTLVETRLIKYKHHKAVAKKFYNIDLTEETFLKHYGKPFDVVIKEIYQNKDTLEKMIEANISMRQDFLKKIYPGSLSAVETLLDRGIKIGLLTATKKRFALDDLNRYKFPVERFIVVQGPEDTEVHKPDPAVFLPLLAKLKEKDISNEEILYVGDAIRDFKAAVGAGLGFVAVTTGLDTEDDFKKLGVKNIIKDISELPELIKKL